MSTTSSSTLSRYTRPVDGTIPVPALLYEDEELLASQDGVGLYDGASKSAPHQSGTVHITSHRLFFISSASTSAPASAGPSFHEDLDDGASLALDISHVVYTESYAGFFKSSPKVTLYLAALNDGAGPSRLMASSPTPATSSNANTPTNDAGRSRPLATASNNVDDDWSSWECTICGNRNPPGLSPAARSVCTLCGMPRDLTTVNGGPVNLKPASTRISVPQLSISSSNYISSRSLPSSGRHTPLPLTSSNSASTGNDEISCPACTFLNHPGLRDCEMCGTPLKQPTTPSSSRPQSHYLTPQPSKSAPVSRPSSPEPSERESGKVGNKYIRLSFRKGGDKAFYAALKTSLQVKGWQGKGNTKWKASDGDTTPTLSGIGGLLQNVEFNAKTTERGMSSAFSDLEALMRRAQDMVRLANDLNEQLAANTRRGGTNTTDEEPEEVAFVRSSLAKLGLTMKNAPVTSDMTSDEREYIQKLAKELAEVLQGDGGDDDWLGVEAIEGAVNKRSRGLMKQRGIVGLDEVWGGWNRVRGVALIPPETAIKTLRFLPHYTSPPVTHRKLASGLLVLHTPPYSIQPFTARLLGRIDVQGPCTTLEVAQMEGLTVGFAGEMINEVESAGDIMRDDASAGLRGGGAGAGISSEVRWWTTSMLKGYVWDGQID